MFEKNFLKIEVAETERNRDYWAARPWATQHSVIRSAEAFLLPWHELKDDALPMYPQGTSDFLKAFRDQGLSDLSVVVAEREYAELAMYGRSWRLPTLFLTMLAVPVAVEVLGNRLSDVLPGVKSDDEMQIELIVERPNAPCIKFAYKGPVSRVPDTLIREMENCFETKANPK